MKAEVQLGSGNHEGDPDRCKLPVRVTPKPLRRSLSLRLVPRALLEAVKEGGDSGDILTHLTQQGF